ALAVAALAVAGEVTRRCVVLLLTVPTAAGAAAVRLAGISLARILETVISRIELSALGLARLVSAAFPATTALMSMTMLHANNPSLILVVQRRIPVGSPCANRPEGSEKMTSTRRLRC